MPKPVKRSYRSAIREEAARQTRRAILTAATDLFLERGYSGLTMQAVAETAGVALDTVYAAAGPKPMLVRLLIETAISGRDVPVSAHERDYVLQIRAAATAREKLAIYAGAVTRIQARVAPLVQALRAASRAHPELASLWDEIAERRARNMLEFADDLLATGEVRRGLDRETIADIVWSMNAPEYYVLLVQDRGWASHRFEAWLTEAWTRLFLNESACD